MKERERVRGWEGGREEEREKESVASVYTFTSTVIITDIIVKSFREMLIIQRIYRDTCVIISRYDNHTRVSYLCVSSGVPRVTIIRFAIIPHFTLRPILRAFILPFSKFVTARTFSLLHIGDQLFTPSDSRGLSLSRIFDII